MSDNIKNLEIPAKFPKEGELMDRMTRLIDEYAGELSLVSVLGVLCLKQQELIHNI